MSREKSIFEQMGGTYTEIDGILFPNICIGEEQTEAMHDTFSGKYGDLWKKYVKENQTERYYHLVRTGQLKQKVAEINEEANEMLERIMQQYLQKHKPEIQTLQWKCGSFGNKLKLWQRKWFFMILSTVIIKLKQKEREKSWRI